MKVKSKKRTAAKPRVTAKEAHEALDRIHAAARKSGADKLTDDEIDELIAKARTKKKPATKS